MKMKTMRREEMMTKNSRDRRKSHAVRLLYIPDLEGKVYLVQIYSTTSTICNSFSSPETVDVFQHQYHIYWLVNLSVASLSSEGAKRETQFVVGMEIRPDCLSSSRMHLFLLV